MFSRIPPATQALLIANALLFLLQSVFGPVTFLDFMLWPPGDHLLGYQDFAPVTVGFLPWQVVSYGFLHGSLPHLFFNMLALVMFGAPLEATWGSRRFAWYWFVCVAGAGVVQLIVANYAVQQGADPYPTVGASGGVFGVLLAYGMLFPHQRVMLLFPPIPMQARTLVIVYGALELFLGLSGARTGIAHFAHLGGMLFGFLLLQYWRGRWPFRPRPRA